MTKRPTADMMAPCGVMCYACSAFLDEKRPCPGCRAPAQKQKRKSCQNCAKKRCAAEKGLAWCFACSAFPCGRIKSLSKRYVRNYGIDLVQNGLCAKQDMDAFLETQQVRFACRECGGTIDQHHRRCSRCGAALPPQQKDG